MARLNRILNKTIKAVLKAITILLVNAAITYLLKSKILKYCKEIIIVILQKANKKDYFLPKSYWLVALKNILGKILKKIVVKRIQEAIKV